MRASPEAVNCATGCLTSPWVCLSPRTIAKDADAVGDARARAGSEAVATGSPSSSSAAHIVVLVNGLTSHRKHWKAVAKYMSLALCSKYVIYVSTANEYTQTHDGIDVCGERLCKELCSVASSYPALKEISFIGHSMGGLIARYAAGKLYDSATRKVLGLTPVHYMSLATPHVGCGHELDYTQPAVSKTLMKLLGNRLYLQASDWMFRNSAKQLNWKDGNGDVKPLIWRLAWDDATEKPELYFSALASFETRTAYANVKGDMLVNWSNAALQLPSAKAPAAAKNAVGVFLEDPLKNAWAPGMWPAALRDDPEAAKPRVVTVSQDRGDAAAGGEVADEAGEALGETMPDEARQERSKADEADVMASSAMENSSLPSPHVEVAMTKLRTLNWRRIDVSFKGVALASLAHNHIMMQHAFFNRVGRSVVKHVAEQFKAMEAARDASAS